LNRDKNKINIEAASGLSDSQIARGSYEVGEGIIGRVVEYKRPVIIQSVKARQDQSEEISKYFWDKVL
jgi:Nif-specific regulatory protein